MQCVFYREGDDEPDFITDVDLDVDEENTNIDKLRECIVRHRYGGELLFADKPTIESVERGEHRLKVVYALYM